MARRKTVDLEGMEQLIADALRRGLEKSDANMVRVANDMLNQSEADEAFANIEIEIVPYEIPDTSLRQIVLKAPEHVIDEIVDALAERRRLAEFGGTDEG